MELMKIDTDKIIVEKGYIDFQQYNEILLQATNVAKWLETLEINEENLKEAKKLVAEVRKRVNALEDVRKDIKREILKPYQMFETQVKEIVRIVSDAEQINRDKIAIFDEKERDKKFAEVAKIYNLRIVKYPEIENLINFDDFIKNEYLNKTYSINKVEMDIVERLEQIKKDIEVINKMDNSTDIMINYLNNGFDLGLAIQISQSDNELKEKIKTNEIINDKKFYLEFDNESDFKLAKLLLEKEKVKFKEV